MILVTVGTQFGFDRLVKWMDDWSEANPNKRVFAQIGGGKYLPNYMEWVKTISPGDFSPMLDHCEVVVTHAGMGTIISACLARKPIIVVPREARLGEHRNDHQLATARKFSRLGGCQTVREEDHLHKALATPLDAARTLDETGLIQMLRSLESIVERGVSS